MDVNCRLLIETIAPQHSIDPIGPLQFDYEEYQRKSCHIAVLHLTRKFLLRQPDTIKQYLTFSIDEGVDGEDNSTDDTNSSNH